MSSGNSGDAENYAAKTTFDGVAHSVVQQAMNSGGAFVLPAIYPVPSRDQLRGMLDDALRRSDGVTILKNGWA